MILVFKFDICNLQKIRTTQLSTVPGVMSQVVMSLQYRTGQVVEAGCGRRCKKTYCGIPVSCVCMCACEERARVRESLSHHHS